MSRYIYIHICCINNWAEIIAELLDHIKNSGLYDTVDEIRCGILGIPEESPPFFADPKVKIIFQNMNIGLWEVITINALREYALDHPEEDFQVLYLHSKGVRYNGTSPIIYDWVSFLTYITIYKYEPCIASLAEYSAVGANLICDPVPHFSGNFWWTTSDHIRKLPVCPNHYYNAPEFWVTGLPGSYLSLWNSGVSHYDSPYPPSLYLNKPLQPKYLTISEKEV
jgi:hypothetical protein